jgi:hypothetical protein
MSTLTIQMPDSIAEQLRACATAEGVTVDQLLCTAASEKISAMLTVAFLRQRARRANRTEFIAFLDASPDVPPPHESAQRQRRKPAHRRRHRNGAMNRNSET